MAVMDPVEIKQQLEQENREWLESLYKVYKNKSPIRGMELI